MHLDVTTAIFLNITGTFFISLFLFFVTRSYLGAIKGIKYWAIGMSFQCVGWAFLPLSKAVNLSPLFKCIGASLILVSLACYFHALKQFKEINLPVRWAYWSVAVAFCLQLASVFIWHSEAYRIGVVSLFAALFSFATSFFLLSKRQTPISHQLTGCVFMLCAIVTLVRAYYYFFVFQIDQNLLQSNTVQDVSYLAFYVTIILGSFGFLLMCSDKYFVMQKELVEQERCRRVEQSQFMAMLAHELKTPLSVIRFGLGSKMFCEEIHLHSSRAINDIDNVIDRCLLSEKIADHKIEFNMGAFSIQELFEKLTDATQMSQRLEFTAISPESIYTDEQLLYIILFNLIDNALKYSPPESQVQIVVQSEKKWITFSVKNLIGTSGYPDKEKVFQKYYRNKLAFQQTGSGLGLYLVKAMANLLNGDVEYEVNPPYVLFKLKLPLQSI
jgi:signal transduction histidine kinase